MLVEAPGLLVLGMHHEGADAGNLSRLQSAAHGVREQRRPEPSALPVRRQPASSITGIGWRAMPFATRDGAVS